MLITLYNNSTWYMLSYHIYEVIRSYLHLQKLTMVLYKKKKKTLGYLNHDNHILSCYSC